MKKNYGVSALLALNNIDIYTKLAIDSILFQTRQVDEFIIVINGPNRELIKQKLIKYYGDEAIIKFFTTELGQLAYALNYGLCLCNYEYVLRMDADDISNRDRVEKQLNYIDKNELDVLGCDINIINSDGEITGAKKYPTGIQIDKKIPFMNVFCHPSVIFRRDKILSVRGYNAGYNSEDYDLWLRLSRDGVKWDNLSEILFRYRVHNSTAQRKPLAYAETASLMLRECLLRKSLIYFFAMLVAIAKFFFRSR
ncbi:glycosyltransferase [Yersinia kristensenii]|uniref:glycosyltransferase n=1 Tax=Yersinia kristensenii TaxID=28152 RepID=UPI0011A0938C|nr:glycosyltransferase [Yersinia kristensenii]MBW5812744.1 glycosyltransferase [Yersinia kristensenii]MBW5825307.1 glycosyltransferase [Yersinia kristensenii]MBW5829955.1 glycosyltransferase [Yersinia kristensenii]